MKSKLLIFIMLMAPVAVCGQVMELSLSVDSNSIVRTVGTSQVLIYTQQSVDVGYFVLYHPGDSAARCFRVLDKWQVRDVRIHNGTYAFFCGTRGGVGLVGMFNIAQTFNGVTPLYYTLCSWSDAGYVRPADLKRLDLFTIGGQACMAMVGSSLWDQSVMLPNTTVVSASLSGGTWNLTYYVNKGWYMKHTDVVCLDDMIVSVGTDTSGRECYVKTFDKQLDFPYHALTPNKLVSILHEQPVGDVLAVRRGVNEAVVAQYNRRDSVASTVLYDVPFSSVSGMPAPPPLNLRRSPLSDSTYDPTWRLMELNWLDGDAWLLQRTAYAGAPVAGVAEWMVKVPMTTPAPAWMWHPELCFAQSMDMHVLQQLPFLTGRALTSRLSVYLPTWIDANTNCYRFFMPLFDANMFRWIPLEINDGVDRVALSGTSFSPRIENRPIIEICR